MVANIKNGNIFEPNNAFSRLTTHDKATAFGSRIKWDMRPVRSSGMNYLDAMLCCARAHGEWDVASELKFFIYPFVVILSRFIKGVPFIRIIHDATKLSMQLKECNKLINEIHTMVVLRQRYRCTCRIADIVRECCGEVRLDRCHT